MKKFLLILGIIGISMMSLAEGEQPIKKYKETNYSESKSINEIESHLKFNVNYFIEKDSLRMVEETPSSLKYLKVNDEPNVNDIPFNTKKIFNIYNKNEKRTRK